MADAWLKFYPQDWRADERLRNCGLAARGLWMEMLALMHRSERYGYLLINGKAPTERQLAVQVGAHVDELSPLLSELESEAVFSRDKHATIYSRRMIRDEKRAQNARKNGKHGGNPRLVATHEEQRENPASDNPELNLSDKGGVKAHMPEARSQKPEGVYSHKPVTETSRENPPPGITDAKIAFEYVCIAADWRATNDTQRQNGIAIIDGWLALGCTLELILDGITKARRSDPAPTRSLKRFDSTVRGMRRDQLGGDLPVTGADVEAITSGVAKRMAVGG